MKVYHEFGPIFNKESKILILGSIPSVKSREIGFYYMHPQNRFWKILNSIFQNQDIESIDKKVSFLKNNKIALWDVLSSCNITSSKDNTIRDIEVNDINFIIKNSNVKTIFTTGKTAYNLYQKYCYPKTKLQAIYLPSTSGANCRIKFDTLLKEYSIIKKYL